MLQLAHEFGCSSRQIILVLRRGFLMKVNLGVGGGIVLPIFFLTRPRGTN